MVLKRPAPVSEAPLELSEVPKPEPRLGQLLIRVEACGVCRTDLHVVEGELPPRLPNVIPGHQIVGRVEKVGDAPAAFHVGQRVGVAWLHSTCDNCAHCGGDQENLCDAPEFTGWTVNGGFAEYVVAPAAFVYELPDGLASIEIAPLLCAGIIGYRALRLTDLGEFEGKRLGIYGFGAAGHVAIQIARARGAEVFVCTRDPRQHGSLAEELGAAWIGDARERPPQELDAGIVFAPAGDLVPVGLSHLRKGGTLVLGGIHMSDIPSFPYQLIYGERTLRSVANNTREDGWRFLDEAARIGVKTRVQSFDLSEANQALRLLKDSKIRGAAVLTV